MSSTLAGLDALRSSTRGGPGTYDSHFPLWAQECEEGLAGGKAGPAGAGAEHPWEYLREEQEGQGAALHQVEGQEALGCKEEALRVRDPW